MNDIIKGMVSVHLSGRSWTKHVFRGEKGVFSLREISFVACLQNFDIFVGKFSLL